MKTTTNTNVKTNTPKNTIKKAISILMIALIMISAIGCGNQEPKNTKNKTYKIGVIQLTEHAALDASCQGFVDGLDASGIKYTIDIQNAQGEQSICNTIASKFVNDDVDLILAIATQAAQAATQATMDIPVLVTAVTDPAAAGLVATNSAPGGNVSGTSDLNPVKKQVELLMKLVPSAKTVGIMYHSSEDNSILQADMAKAELEKSNLKVKIFTAADTNEVAAVTEKAASSVDVIYIPTDNLFADTMSTVSMIATPAGTPVICGESNMVKAGGLATYSISYHQLGEKAAAQAIKVLVDGVDIGTLPIEYSDDLSLVINEEIAAQLKITIPKDLR